MLNSEKIYSFCYNCSPNKKFSKSIILEYRKGPNKNVSFYLPKFINELDFVPDRYLDLLEIASYIYCADRYISRGNKKSPYFTGWNRNFEHNVFVRDYKFWSKQKVRTKLESTLSFLSGDSHQFKFFPGHITPKVHMFDGEHYWPSLQSKNSSVVMFSGGLDSTCGVLDLLANTSQNIYLASHVSSPGIKKTQNSIIKGLSKNFPDRVHHLAFGCNLTGKRAREETQRTRAFLYAAVGATVARRYHQDRIFFFENGVLSVNLPPSEQYQNARVTRTTHPRFLADMAELVSMISGKTFKIVNPFFWMTKADIIKLLKDNGGSDYISSTVSCSRTFDKGVKHDKTHCGRCSQCIDRRFGFAGASLLELENRGTYAYDFVTDNICPDNDDEFGREERTILVDYLRVALEHLNINVDTFYDNWLDQLTDLVDCIEGSSDENKIERLHNLFERHGSQVRKGILAFQNEYADIMLGTKPSENSLFEILSTRPYLEKPARLVASRISDILKTSVPLAFQSRKPKNENEVQDQIEALLNDETYQLQREYPYVQFALARTVPDFSGNSPSLFIEVKYLRGKISPSQANKELSEDFTKYPNEAFLLVVIYDPERKVKNDMKFSKDFEQIRDCEFCFIR
ncbi:MAG: 7-cyano-7-deazaguanine synthase [Proteobacteria bacterium]|nr:7-cyano-7-deazaguanine synthase [Pseudomonadota bacterium]MBU4288553.1 7-cyano-7-deazaguanine synthase [Pseudomonadota bacterium]MBU4414127.1 7-cyano-7-deazaguanine synthase [Pseudomonadota bacterium]MCG2830531.1 7-cyano-7-deazaguanine synthase [Desulfobacteraceae bacterium]